MILRTRFFFSSAASPTSPLPALLLTMVRSRAPCTISASISRAALPSSVAVTHAGSNDPDWDCPADHHCRAIGNIRDCSGGRNHGLVDHRFLHSHVRLSHFCAVNEQILRRRAASVNERLSKYGAFIAQLV